MSPATLPSLVELVRCNTRTSRPSVKLSDYERYTVQSVASSASSVSSGTCPYPIASYDTINHFFANHHCFLTTVQTEVEPTRFSKAVQFPQWRTVMQ